MERLRFRSTGSVDLMAELHQRDMLDEALRRGERESAPIRRRARPFGLRIFWPRPRNG